MGKSRYEPLVKLKKKGLDEAERALLSANNEAAVATEELAFAYETLASFSLPSHGSIRELAQVNTIIQLQHTVIDHCKERVAEAVRKQQQLREYFERSRIEFEKFKYLEVQEMNARIRKAKEQEAKFLDEIGTMTHKREKK
jgi:flagellar export protein FliJ